MAPVGTAVVAMAAKKHAVPFVVLVGLHKLSPLFPHDPDISFNEFRSPAGIINYDVMAEPLQSHQRLPEMDDGVASTEDSCASPSQFTMDVMFTSIPLGSALKVYSISYIDLQRMD